jgi:sec-independent protein translocase protein TatC
MAEMSFLEHLQELRKRLIICLVALFIGTGVGWPLSKPLQDFILRPLNEPSVVEKLNYRVLSWAHEQLPRVIPQGQPPEARRHPAMTMSPLEAFFVQMKISFIIGLILAFPVILYQLWLFLAPALYAHEKKYVYFFLPFGTVSFVLGDLFFLYLVWPLIISFSLSYETANVIFLPNLTQYVKFCLRLLVLFGLIFELPLIMLILNRIGLVGVDFLKRQRRLALLVSVVVAALYADVMSMLALAIPIYGMFELAILCVRLFGRQVGAAPAPASVPAGGPGLEPPQQSD